MQALQKEAGYATRSKSPGPGMMMGIGSATEKGGLHLSCARCYVNGLCTVKAMKLARHAEKFGRKAGIRHADELS